MTGPAPSVQNPIGATALRVHLSTVGNDDGWFLAERLDGLIDEQRLPAASVPVVADVDGRVADVGEPVNGARHDAAALFISGVAERWARRLAAGERGLLDH